MPSYFISPHQPRSDIGEGLERVTRALFARRAAGRDPETEEARQGYFDAGSRDRLAQEAKHRAEAAKIEAEQRKIEAEQRGRAGYLDTALAHLFGTQNAPTVQNWMRTRNFGEREISPAITLTGDDEGNAIESPLEIAPRVAGPAERPAWFTPELESETMREAALARLILAGGGNADQLAKAGGHLQDQGFERDLVAGRMPARTFYQLQGRPVQGVDDGYRVDLTGTDTNPTPLGTANARIDRDRAAATASRSQAGLSDARAEDVIIRSIFPEDYQRPAPRPATPPADRFIRPSQQDRAAITAELNALKGAGNEALAFGDPMASNAVMARALQHFSTPGTPAYGNPALAASQAMADVFPAGVEVERNLFGSNKIRPKAGSRATVTTTGGNSGLPPEARSRLREGVVTTFGNGTSWTLQGGVPVQVH